MIFASIRLALADVFSPPFRATLWKTLGLTILVLIAMWFAITGLAEALAIPVLGDFLAGAPEWLDGAGVFAGIAAGVLLAVALGYLIGPISAVIAGFFLDDVAEVVERRSYPEAPAGTALSLVKGAVLSVKFFGVVILGNILAFTMLLVPGVNLAAFFLVNGYLLGREYFEFAALRYRSEEDAKALRGRYSGTVFAAGLVVAAFLAVPIVNLLTPLFAAALMVHLHQRIVHKEGGFARLADDASEMRREAGAVSTDTPRSF